MCDNSQDDSQRAPSAGRNTEQLNVLTKSQLNECALKNQKKLSPKSAKTQLSTQLNENSSKNQEKLSTQDRRFQENFSKNSDGTGKSFKNAEKSSNQHTTKQKKTSIPADGIRVQHRTYNKPSNRKELGNNKFFPSYAVNKNTKSFTGSMNSDAVYAQGSVNSAIPAVEHLLLVSSQQEATTQKALERNAQSSITPPPNSFAGTEDNRSSASTTGSSSATNSRKYNSIEADLGIKTDCLKNLKEAEETVQKWKKEFQNKKKTTMFLPNAFADSNFSEATIPGLYGQFKVTDVRMHFDESGERVGSGTMVVLEEDAENVENWAHDRNWRAIRLTKLVHHEDDAQVNMFFEFPENDWSIKLIEKVKELSGDFENENFRILHSVDGNCAKAVIARTSFRNIFHLIGLLRFTQIFGPTRSLNMYQFEE